METSLKPKRIGQALHDASFENWKKVSEAIGETPSSLVNCVLAALTPEEARSLYDRGSKVVGDVPRTVGKASAVAKSVRALNSAQLAQLMAAAEEKGIKL